MLNGWFTRRFIGEVTIDSEDRSYTADGFDHARAVQPQLAAMNTCCGNRQPPSSDGGAAQQVGVRDDLSAEAASERESHPGLDAGATRGGTPERGTDSAMASERVSE